ncbi:MAG: glucose-6-phosphate dehydrogenase [Candidatus Woesearchaeota archaeon]
MVEKKTGNELKGREPFLIVILGATGDLAKKKLVPAIYRLFVNKRVGDFALIGVGRRPLSTDKWLEASRPYIKNLEKKNWKTLKKISYYFRADFYESQRWAEFGAFIRAIEQKHKLSGNRIFHLATMPEHFEVIIEQLHKQGLAAQKAGNGWRRVVFEKPFGSDLASAKHINKTIRKVFDESQIYRIDHYLGKELVQNISVLRFTNQILEPLWNKENIDHIQIILSEDFGIEGRGAYYDRYGALKDVVQNHMLQLLCLTAMESPYRLTADSIRDEKMKILKAIRKINPKDVVLGQYRGYTREKGVKKNSKTETFVAAKLFVDSWRWSGLPFYFITGKKMKEKITSIYIQFKQAPCLLFEGICLFVPNYLVIQIQPEEGFYIRLNAKVPGKMDITPIKLEFCHPCIFGPNTPEAYENLIADVVAGDQSVFLRDDEIELSWKIIDDLIAKKPKISIYNPGSYPKEADELIRKDGRSWHLVVK